VKRFPPFGPVKLEVLYLFEGGIVREKFGDLSISIGGVVERFDV